MSVVCVLLFGWRAADAVAHGSPCAAVLLVPPAEAPHADTRARPPAARCVYLPPGGQGRRHHHALRRARADHDRRHVRLGAADDPRAAARAAHLFARVRDQHVRGLRLLPLQDGGRAAHVARGRVAGHADHLLDDRLRGAALPLRALLLGARPRLVVGGAAARQPRAVHRGGDGDHPAHLRPAAPVRWLLVRRRALAGGVPSARAWAAVRRGG